MKKVLIFDYDGTVVDSFEIAYKFLNRVLKQIDQPCFESREQLASVYDVNFYEGMKKHGVHVENQSAFNDVYIAEAEKENSPILPFPGIKDILRNLAKNYHLVMVTSAYERDVIPRLKEDSIDYFKPVLGAETSLSKVDKFKKLLKEYDGCDFYYICDTSGDILEAKEVGIKTVAVTWGFHDKKKLLRVKPDLIVDKPKELLEIF